MVLSFKFDEIENIAYKLTRTNQKSTLVCTQYDRRSLRQVHSILVFMDIQN